MLLLVKLRHCFLSFEMGVEGNQLFAHLSYHRDLLLKQGIQISHILLDIRPWLVHLVKQVHLLFDQVNHIIDVPAVASDHLLFFL